MRRTALAKAGLTSVPCRRWRFRLRVFFVRMWFLRACRRLTFPLPVSLKRLAAPRWVLSFGTILLFECAPLPLQIPEEPSIWPGPSLGEQTQTRLLPIMHDREAHPKPRRSPLVRELFFYVFQAEPTGGFADRVGELHEWHGPHAEGLAVERGQAEVLCRLLVVGS